MADIVPYVHNALDFYTPEPEIFRGGSSMTTVVSIDWSAKADYVTVSSGESTRTVNNPHPKDAIAWAAFQEYKGNGTTSGTVTVTAT